MSAKSPTPAEAATIGLFNPVPFPYFIRKPDLKLVDDWVANTLFSMRIKTENEFPHCAIVHALSKLHLDHAPQWEPVFVRFQRHWETIKDLDDRPGMNDYHIVSWGITGDTEHLKILHQASKRTGLTRNGVPDMRGASARWAIGCLRQQGPEFAKAFALVEAADRPDTAGGMITDYTPGDASPP